ncbi:MAG: CDP-diacylglycerol--glycerol-3-phosphate 3-phosphatidyltransferase [Thermoguttaceae bacterium]
MSVSTQRARRMWAAALNLPNQVTYLRILGAIVMFVAIVWEYYLVAFVLFALAAATDWLDGYFARKYGQVTVLGRILDPFADKVIICGTFIFLAAVPQMARVPWGLRPWMVVVMVGRELLVTAIRSFIEEEGFDFSAALSGKLKMVLQCLAAPACLFYLYWWSHYQTVPAWVSWTMALLVWGAVLQTVYSGLIYVVAAIRLVRSSR